MLEEPSSADRREVPVASECFDAASASALSQDPKFASLETKVPDCLRRMEHLGSQRVATNASCGAQCSAMLSTTLTGCEGLFLTESNGLLSQLKFIREAIRPAGGNHWTAIHLLVKIKVVFIKEDLKKINECIAIKICIGRTSWLCICANNHKFVMIEYLRRKPFSSVGSELRWRLFVVIVSFESSCKLY